MRVPAVPLLRDLGGAANLFLREVRNFLQGVAGQPILWGNRVSAEFTGAGTINVPHGLDRQPLAYVIEGRSADISVFDGGTPTTEHFVLTSTGAGTVRLWVY